MPPVVPTVPIVPNAENGRFFTVNNLLISKTVTIFAASSPKTILLVFVCVAIFIATNTALYAAETGLPIHNNCCALKPVIVFGEMWKGSLSSFKYFNFSFMPKTVKNYSTAKNSTRTVTSSHETGTFLENRNIQHLMQLFNTPQNYARHVGCLWVLRDLVEKAIGNTANPTGHKLFPLFDTVNQLIGCLLRFDVHFDECGRAYTIQNKQKVFI
jgi:hypothetical protein